MTPFALTTLDTTMKKTFSRMTKYEAQVEFRVLVRHVQSATHKEIAEFFFSTRNRGASNKELQTKFGLSRMHVINAITSLRRNGFIVEYQEDGYRLIGIDATKAEAKIMKVGRPTPPLNPLIESVFR